MQFDKLWAKLGRELSVPQEIRNWTAHSGYIGDDFVAKMASSGVLCILQSGNERRVPKGDFETVYQMWLDYLKGGIRRSDIVSDTRHSKYIISILHEFLDRGQHTSSAVITP